MSERGYIYTGTSFAYSYWEGKLQLAVVFMTMSFLRDVVVRLKAAYGQRKEDGETTGSVPLAERQAKCLLVLAVAHSRLARIDGRGCRATTHEIVDLVRSGQNVDSATLDSVPEPTQQAVLHMISLMFRSVMTEAKAAGTSALAAFRRLWRAYSPSLAIHQNNLYETISQYRLETALTHVLPYEHLATLLSRRYLYQDGASSQPMTNYTPSDWGQVQTGLFSLCPTAGIRVQTQKGGPLAWVRFLQAFLRAIVPVTVNDWDVCRGNSISPGDFTLQSQDYEQTASSLEEDARRLLGLPDCVSLPALAKTVATDLPVFHLFMSTFRRVNNRLVAGGLPRQKDRTDRDWRRRRQSPCSSRDLEKRGDGTGVDAMNSRRLFAVVRELDDSIQDALDVHAHRERYSPSSLTSRPPAKAKRRRLNRSPVGISLATWVAAVAKKQVLEPIFMSGVTRCATERIRIQLRSSAGAHRSTRLDYIKVWDSVEQTIHQGRMAVGAYLWSVCQRPVIRQACAGLTGDEECLFLPSSLGGEGDDATWEPILLERLQQAFTSEREPDCRPRYHDSLAAVRILFARLVAALPAGTTRTMGADAVMPSATGVIVFGSALLAAVSGDLETVLATGPVTVDDLRLATSARVALRPLCDTIDWAVRCLVATVSARSPEDEKMTTVPNRANQVMSAAVCDPASLPLAVRVIVSTEVVHSVFLVPDTISASDVFAVPTKKLRATIKENSPVIPLFYGYLQTLLTDTLATAVEEGGSPLLVGLTKDMLPWLQWKDGQALIKELVAMNRANSMTFHEHLVLIKMATKRLARYELGGFPFILPSTCDWQPFLERRPAVAGEGERQELALVRGGQHTAIVSACKCIFCPLYAERAVHPSADWKPDVSSLETLRLALLVQQNPALVAGNKPPPDARRVLREWMAQEDIYKRRIENACKLIRVDQKATTPIPVAVPESTGRTSRATWRTKGEHKSKPGKDDQNQALASMISMALQMALSAERVREFEELLAQALPDVLVASDQVKHCQRELQDCLSAASRDRSRQCAAMWSAAVWPLFVGNSSGDEGGEVDPGPSASSSAAGGSRWEVVESLVDHLPLLAVTVEAEQPVGRGVVTRKVRLVIKGQLTQPYTPPPADQEEKDGTLPAHTDDPGQVYLLWTDQGIQRFFMQGLRDLLTLSRLLAFVGDHAKLARGPASRWTGQVLTSQTACLHPSWDVDHILDSLQPLARQDGPTRRLSVFCEWVLSSLWPAYQKFVLRPSTARLPASPALGEKREALDAAVVHFTTTLVSALDSSWSFMVDGVLVGIVKTLTTDQYMHWANPVHDSMLRRHFLHTLATPANFCQTARLYLANNGCDHTQSVLNDFLAARQVLTVMNLAESTSARGFVHLPGQGNDSKAGPPVSSVDSVLAIGECCRAIAHHTLAYL